MRALEAVDRNAFLRNMRQSSHGNVGLNGIILIGSSLQYSSIIGMGRISMLFEWVAYLYKNWLLEPVIAKLG